MKVQCNIVKSSRSLSSVKVIKMFIIGNLTKLPLQYKRWQRSLKTIAIIALIEQR